MNWRNSAAQSRLWSAVATGVLAGALVLASPVGSRIIKFLSWDEQIEANAEQMLSEGRQTFRFDTFGDEAFWGGMLQLHRAIEGAQFGGVGPGLSPSAALALGLKDFFLLLEVDVFDSQSP